MTANLPPIYLLPGLGGDARLFDLLREHLPDVRTPDWPEFPRGGTLSDYGRLIARTLDTSRPFVLGGMSFGGIVALEAVPFLDPKPLQLVLIASARNRDCVSPRFRNAERAGRLIPNWVVRRMLTTIAAAICKRNGFAGRPAELIHGMARDADITLLKRHARALCAWERDGDATELGVPIVQIHGGNDTIIPPHPRHTTHLLEGRRHLLPLVHAAELAETIRSACEPRVATVA